MKAILAMESPPWKPPAPARATGEAARIRHPQGILGCGLRRPGTGRPNPVRDQPESGTEQGEREPDCPNQGSGEVAADDLVTSGRKRDRSEDPVRTEQGNVTPVHRRAPAGGEGVQDHEVAGM